MSNEEAIRKLSGLKEEGYGFVCLGCDVVYKEKPREWYEDGHGGRLIEMCRCGSDLFETIDWVIRRLEGRRDRESKIKSQPPSNPLRGLCF